MRRLEQIQEPHLDVVSSLLWCTTHGNCGYDLHAMWHLRVQVFVFASPVLFSRRAAGLTCIDGNSWRQFQLWWSEFSLPHAVSSPLQANHNKVEVTKAPNYREQNCMHYSSLALTAVYTRKGDIVRNLEKVRSKVPVYTLQAVNWE